MILEYFIPGFIFISVFQFFTSRKDSNYKIVDSVVVSYVIKALCSIGHQHILYRHSFTWGERVVILSLVAFLSSILFVLVSELHIVNEILLKINAKSAHDDIWHDVIDYKNGTSLRIVCDDTVYTGVLAGHEEKGNDSWFILDDYIVEENNLTYAAEDMKIRSKLALKLKDVKRIELYYGKPQKAIREKIGKWFHTFLAILIRSKTNNKK